MLQWYLILTKPSGEKTAEVNLQRLGYRVCFPRLVRPALRRGRWGEQIVPLFPRYVFLQLDAGRQSLGPARSTLGVANVVRFGSEYAVVPDRVVEGLIERADPQTGLHRLQHRQLFEPGSPVRIVDGTFDGLDGIFERETGGERVIVLLNLLGQDVRVGVTAGCVFPKHAY